MTIFGITRVSGTPEDGTTCDKDTELWLFELNFSSIMTITGGGVGMQYCLFSL
jgi:hypothetical protein